MWNEIEWKKLYQNHTNAHTLKAIRHECIYAVHMKCSQWIASRIWGKLLLLLLMLCVSKMHIPWFLDCFANINLPTEPTANSKQQTTEYLIFLFVLQFYVVLITFLFTPLVQMPFFYPSNRVDFVRAGGRVVALTLVLAWGAATLFPAQSSLVRCRHFVCNFERY